METEFDFPTGTNWFTGAVVNSSVRVRQQVRQTGLTVPDDMWGRMTRTSGSVANESFPPNGDLRDRAANVGPYMTWMMEERAFRKAEEKWKDSYCVAISVPEGFEQYNPPGKKIHVVAKSEKPFTASVKHQFEGKELNLPVIATLTSGEVSVTPSGVKVPAPATFRYKAFEEASFHSEATVDLVSRSRRGIGKFRVIFVTEEQFYRVDAPWENNDMIRIKGTICSFTKPFTLKISGHKPGGNFPYTGKVEFTPTDAISGSWLWTGQYTIPYSPPTSDKGGSTYQVTGLEEGKPIIVLNEFDHMGSCPGIFSKTWHIPGYQIPLIPETGLCLEE
jgi:hypothetical protein